jgi:hypothetical protein
MAWLLRLNRIFRKKKFLSEAVHVLKLCHPIQLANPAGLDETVTPSTKYGMALLLNVINDRKLHSINTYVLVRRKTSTFHKIR